MTTLHDDEDPGLAAYQRTLQGAAELGNRLATEPSEAEVADLLRQQGTESTPEAIDAWLRAKYWRRPADR